MLVRVYVSVPSGKEFHVHRDGFDALICTCKEYRGGMPVSFNVETGRYSSSCRHIRDYRKLAATWSKNPFDTYDWL